MGGYDLSRVAPPAERLAAEGKTVLCVDGDGRSAAVLAVADPIKETTPEVIADRLGIDEVVARVLPDGKVATVRQLQRDRRASFVSDGINDAPRWRRDTGIAIGSGTELAIAIEAVDVVRISDDLRGVVTALALSRATMANIRQNLGWVFAYSTALIPVAAGALHPASGLLLSPVLAALAMALSSVRVLTNALRLRRAARRAA